MRVGALMLGWKKRGATNLISSQADGSRIAPLHPTGSGEAPKLWVRAGEVEGGGAGGVIPRHAEPRKRWPKASFRVSENRCV